MSQVQASKTKAASASTKSKESAKSAVRNAATTEIKAAKPVEKSVLKVVRAPVVEALRLTPQLVQECRIKLLNAKTDILNQVKEVRGDLTMDDKGGDEADQTVRVLAEAEFLNRHDRLRSQLLEIEAALGRTESGSFGTCEETEEPIEPERLRAIPWTRLSIEGAEIRESMNKRFAR